MLVLLTGAAGFIGSHVADRLLERGHRVVGLDNFDDYYPPEIKEQNLAAAMTRQPAFRLVRGDIRDGVLGTLFSREHYDGVVHLAARAGIRPSLSQPRLYCDVNVQGTINLLEHGLRNGVRRFVLASSSSVYGLGTPAPFREDAPCDRPLSPYAASKLAMERFAKVWHELYGLDIACLRFFSIYGPRQRPDLAIHKFARLILDGRPVPIYGDGRASRDYTYVDDAVDGVLQALERSRGFDILNIGESRPVPLNELVKLLEDILGRKARIERLREEPSDVPLTCADLSRSRQHIGYAPTTSLEEGLMNFVRWFKRETR